MLEGLRVAVRVLLDAGCQRVLIDGSFVTAKVHPGDYDGTWDTTGVEFDRLDPVLIDFGNRRRAMKAKYLGELFPARANAASGLTFEQFFQQDRQGRPKGIIELDLGTVP